MNEAAARELLLLQAFESVMPPSPSWGAEDTAWATRLAGQAPAGRDIQGADEAFLLRRAHHAMQRLLPREPALRRWLARRFWRPRWLFLAVVAGAVAGLLADGIGSSQRINLLAPPVWTVIAWNLLVYAVLMAGAVRRALFRVPKTRSGALLRLTERMMQIGRRLPRVAADPARQGGSAAALSRFGASWLQAGAPLASSRAAALLHAGAAALGAGLIAGLYARGLVLDYRAAWESTFLSADSVHGVLATLLAPASRLSGIGLPDVAGFSALRAVHGVQGTGAPAAPWIHLYAATLCMTVVVPRALLAVACAWRARRLSACLAVPLSDPYFQRLFRQRSGDVGRVHVLPYARTPAPRSLAGLQQGLVEALGVGTSCEIAETIPFGSEDDVETAATTMQRRRATTTLQVALFDLTATPEAEHHGVFVRALAADGPVGAATIVCVDEAAFRQRFGATGNRLGERRAAWERLAASLGTVAAVVDLEAAAPTVTAASLQQAMARPVVAAPGRRRE